MPTTMERLQKIINTKKALQTSINNKGGAITDDTPFNEYPLAVDGLSTGGEGQDWAPNTHWWDIKKIVEEDEDEYDNKIIILIDDKDDVLQYLTESTGSKFKNFKVKTSDGAEYTTTSPNHTWDKTKDKPCYIDGAEVYKTRWFMLCFNRNDKGECAYAPSRSILYTMLWYYGKCSSPTSIFLDDFIGSSSEKPIEALPTVENLSIEVQFSSSSSYGLFMNSSRLRVVEGLKNAQFSNKIASFFNGCSSLYKLDLNVNSVTSFESSFRYMTNLREICFYGDTSSATSWYCSFQKNSNLKKISGVQTANATNLSNMFQGCSKLNENLVIDLHKATKAQQTFGECKSLQSVTINRDGTTPCDLYATFSNCTALEEILGDFSFKNVTNASLFIGYDTNIKRISFKDIGIALQVGSGTSWGHLLELDSLINLCKECIKTSSSLKLTVGSANLEKLASVYVKFTDVTQTEIATGEKGEVEVCENTDAGAMTISDYMILKNWTLA